MPRSEESSCEEKKPCDCNYIASFNNAVAKMSTKVIEIAAEKNPDALLHRVYFHFSLKTCHFFYLAGFSRASLKVLFVSINITQNLLLSR